MKKKNLILAVLCICVMLVGCGSKGEVAPAEANDSAQETAADEGKTISVVTTIFPEYDWVRQIVGSNDNVEITMLLDNGVDLHSYQPTADDIMKIASCDLFIYVGGESDT